MVGASVSGPESRDAKSRAPAPVNVRSMDANRLPARSPDKVRANSKLRLVAASMAMIDAGSIWLSVRRRGSAPFWVSWA